MAATSANLNNAQHVSVDSAGNLYISDNTDNRIRKVWAASPSSSRAGLELA
jgi:hypothetical protein